MAASAVRERCETAFGHLWNQVAETYDNKVAPEVHATRDHVAEVAVQTWAAR